ncbi:MAG: HAD family hydrolase [bacterium]|jgi:beta-phosphoglucomutase
MSKAALWDLDGTIVDSEEYHWHAWRETCAAEGVSITYGQFRETFGWRDDDIVPKLMPGVDPARVAELGEAKEAAYRRMVREKGLDPLPGVVDTLRRLHDHGWLQAVASSAPRENIRVVLEVTGLDRTFDAIVSAEDVRIGKPDPEVFLKAAMRLGVAPERCVVVEDAPAGIEGARRAGMKSVGVGSGRDLSAADIAVPSLKHLPDDALEKLVGQ